LSLATRAESEAQHPGSRCAQTSVPYRTSTVRNPPP
jgi:hypothetical protein